MQSVRKTWTLGGIGLVVCGVIGMLQYSLPFGGAALTIVPDIVFAAAVLLFAIGLSARASVVARRPLGVAALVVVALWPFVVRLAEQFLPSMDAETFEAGMDAYRAAEGALTTVFYVDLLVSFAAALIAVVQIARAGILPQPWRWAPLWAMLAAVAGAVIPPLLLVAAGPQSGQALLGVATIVGSLGFLAKTLGLGIIALVLASRVRTGDMEIYRSA
ncbi:hypothetical protein H9651_10880 [Microbacterium sp. Sa4CUA7]|uniref:Uncharacterized protein n=1 Tax=Microbacterium pullorum TaxID=2762236 RepID=A0ABR8S3T3_9MICO|nr:hypothetical protein [Microbacterium pullorum]MBD7958143.1 hypothetical protein [Microbacterium pullorum]